MLFYIIWHNGRKGPNCEGANACIQYQPIQKLQIQTINEMQTKIEQKTLLEMKSLDPFENLVRHTALIYINVNQIHISKLLRSRSCTYLIMSIYADQTF